DGAETIVTHGRLRVSHRHEQQPELNYMGIPYHRGNRDDAAEVEPGDVVRMRFDLLPTSTVIPAGSRLRLTLAGADPRQRFQIGMARRRSLRTDACECRIAMSSSRS